MFTLIRMLPMSRLLGEQLPALLISLAVAELFYKFHSFLLECIAFLVTWLLVDAVLSTALSRLRGPTPGPPAAASGHP